MSFTLKNTSFKGVFLIEIQSYSDTRGDFTELYRKDLFDECGINTEFVQDNISTSKKGTMRGLHFQMLHPQAKLVLPISGKIYDVIIDLRNGSPTFGKTEGFFLEKGKGLFIPKCFAHGFLALENATVMYKCDDFYHSEDEGGILWNDKNLGIDWQKLFLEYSIPEVLLSEKDKSLPLLSSFIFPH